MNPQGKKVNTSVAVNPSILEQLREYKKKNGISISWLIGMLLNNFFGNLEGGENNGKEEK